MKKSQKLIIFILFSAILVLSSCNEPSPIYGTWADNKGDQIVFMTDGTFSATISDYAGILTKTDGTYTILLNAISFQTSEGYQIVSEWDIRGNMLYLDWTNKNGSSFALTLYKIKN